MEQIKHTPGPWDAPKLTFEDDRYFIGYQGNWDIAEIVIAHAPSTVEAMANARLIAAAPKLLAALIALADKVDATSDCDHKRQSCEDIGCIGVEVKAARAAIAAATGSTTQAEGE